MKFFISWHPFLLVGACAFFLGMATEFFVSSRKRKKHIEILSDKIAKLEICLYCDRRENNEI